MAQSVKLSDGSYIDASAVYDASLSKTQQDINAQTNGIGTILDAGAATAETLAANTEKTVLQLYLTEGIWLVIGHSYGRFTTNITNCSIVRMMGLNANLSGDATQQSIGMTEGNRTVYLVLSTGAYTAPVQADKSFTSLIAIRIK